MGQLSELLTLARQRAETQGHPYSGDVTPAEAYALLQHAPGAKLVDVRTRAEWDWVGRVPGAIEIEWNQYPGSVRNPNVIAELKLQVDPEASVVWPCRRGARA